jgi:hypothetical protein
MFARRALAASVVLCVLALPVSAALSAQSLGDLAATEAKRRAASDKAAKTITNADLTAKPPTPADPPKASAGEKAQAPSTTTAPAAAAPGASGNCFGGAMNSSVVHPTPATTAIDWTMDFSNACADAFPVRVTFTVFDKDNVALETDHQDLSLAGHGAARASGRMAVSRETFLRIHHRLSLVQVR